MMRGEPGKFEGLLKSRDEVRRMRVGCGMLAMVREKMAQMVRPGISTLDIDTLAQTMIEEQGAKPAFLGYNGFPGTICSSINEEIVHGIPSAKRVLKEGDLISIDVGLVYDGFYADTAVTVAVGEVRPEITRLIDVTRESLMRGIEAAKVGGRLGDISFAIQSYIEEHKLGVVREYTGHGIGRNLHEAPEVPNWGPAGKGRRLKAGMVIAIEPMVNLGSWKTKVLPDQWTVVTADGLPSAHFEHTIALADEGPEILTKV